MNLPQLINTGTELHSRRVHLYRYIYVYFIIGSRAEPGNVVDSLHGSAALYALDRVNKFSGFATWILGVNAIVRKDFGRVRR